MNEKDLVICSADEARTRAGLDAAAPVLAQRLRERGARAVYIEDEVQGLDWLEAPQARGWLAGAAQTPAAFASAMRKALAQGFVAADAAIVAKMQQPHALPLLSWGEQSPLAPDPSGTATPGADRSDFSSSSPSAARAERESPGFSPSPSGGGPGWGRPPRRLDLYAIVDSAARLRQVLDAGVRTVQLRIKKPASPDAAWHARLRSEVQQAITDSAAAGAELFVNDHWQLAQELGAPGVHLGQEDLLALGEAGRERLGASGMALGVSSHSLWELARARVLAPRYIACGPVWPTLTKDMPWLPQGMDNLAWWCRAAQAPVTAIGGILAPQQVQAVARTGVDGVCIVRGLGEDPRLTVPSYAAALAAGRAEPPMPAPEWPHPSLPPVAEAS
jgi:hydroxymethylpyrimidine kinase/phosphomethylpyrimidine kinase/thiamine-phosphate diphosphorylase